MTERSSRYMPSFANEKVPEVAGVRNEKIRLMALELEKVRQAVRQSKYSARIRTGSGKTLLLQGQSIIDVESGEELREIPQNFEWPDVIVEVTVSSNEEVDLVRFYQLCINPDAEEGDVEQLKAQASTLADELVLSRDEIAEAVSVAIEGVKEVEAPVALTPSDLGLSEEEDFSTEEFVLLLSVLRQSFDIDEPVTPGNETLKLRENNGVALYIQTSTSGQPVFFLAPSDFEV